MDQPPPYPEPGDQGKVDKKSTDCSQWSEQQVADAVGALGPSKAWKRYAAVCIEEELDGPTMMAISVDDLVNYYKFKMPHARVVVKYFQTQSTATTPAPPIMGLTETEMKMVTPLVDLAEKCGVSGEQFEAMIASLATQQDAQLTQVNEWFEHAHSVLNQAHSHCTADIKTRCGQTNAVLTQHLGTIRTAQQHIKDTEAQCLSLPAKTLAEIQARTEQIYALVDQTLAVTLPSLENDVLHLSVDFAPTVLPFFATEDSRLALVCVTLPPPQVSLAAAGPVSSAAHSTGSGVGLERCSPGVETSFTVVAKDSSAQPREVGGDVVVVASQDVELKASVLDKKDGTYQVSYIAGDSKEGKFALSVLLRGRPIRGSPFGVILLKFEAQVACGGRHTMVVKMDRTLIAFGYNNAGQLGDGSKTNRSSPITLFGGVAQVACGGYHTVVLKKDGTVVAFGRNSNGQLGDGSTVERSSPVTTIAKLF